MNRLALSGVLRYPARWMRWNALLSILMLGCSAVSFAAAPRFTGIELLSPKLLVLHFDTEPNRTYIVQVASPTSTAWGTATNAGSVLWKDFFVAPAFPFVNHYVVADSPTNAQRMYRLLAKP